MEAKDNILINEEMDRNGVIKIVDGQHKWIINYRKDAARWDSEGIK